MTTIYDQDYFKVSRIMNIDKMRFLEEFSEFESKVVKKMFLQLKIDILSKNNSGLTTDVKKKIKKDLEKQLEFFNEFYDTFKRRKTYRTNQEAKVAQTIFKECF